MHVVDNIFYKKYINILYVQTLYMYMSVTDPQETTYISSLSTALSFICDRPFVGLLLFEGVFFSAFSTLSVHFFVSRTNT